MRPLAGLLLGLALLAVAGCGSSTGNADPNDKRAAALTCLTQDKGVKAKLVGADSILVGDSPGAPRIQFFLTAGEAEAQQFLGHGEGAEQINSALLYTRQGSPDVLQNTEDCLDQL